MTKMLRERVVTAASFNREHLIERYLSHHVTSGANQMAYELSSSSLTSAREGLTRGRRRGHREGTFACWTPMISQRERAGVLVSKGRRLCRSQPLCSLTRLSAQPGPMDLLQEHRGGFSR